MERHNDQGHIQDDYEYNMPEEEETRGEASGSVKLLHQKALPMRKLKQGTLLIPSS